VKRSDSKIGNFKKVKYIYKRRFTRFLLIMRYSRISKKIIIHGLWDPITIISLSLKVKFLKKSYWVIWGGDLYNNYFDRNSNFQAKFIHFFRKRVVKKIGSIISIFTKEYDLIQQWYKSEPKFAKSFSYLSNIATLIEPRIPSQKLPKNILLGHSAVKENKHLEYLSLIDNKIDIKLYVILSYGDKEYRNLVIEEGYNRFKEKFVPITHFMPLDEYNELLNEIDIAIFPAEIQIGFGNLVNLVSLGKKIYLSDTVAPKIYFEQIGVKTYSTHDLTDLLNIDHESLEKNVSIIRNRHSLENLKNQWATIFNDII
jgi:hypothetical protein